ncbi:polysaccharide deacetylase family protein [Eremococcus coleocola]|uniref:polysaccharide deacetylase family protein n=1 Tax=Eremococcus coleocola TaxID=88132 RepID=UPI0004083C01|nr:polysaccharide deacetylase family protein [Eremococcus coleocola]
MQTDKRINGIIIGLAGLILLILVGLVFYMFQGTTSASQAAQAQAAVDSLFTDESHNYLNPEYSKEKLATTQKQIKKVGFLDRSNYQSQVQQAEKLYQGLSDLDQVFEGNQIKDRGVAIPKLADLAVKVGVDQALLEQQSQKLEGIAQTGTGQDLKSLYQDVTNLIDAKAGVMEQVKALPEINDDFDSLSQAAQAVANFSDTYANYLKQGLYKDVQDQLNQYGQKVGQMIVEYPTALDQNPNLLDLLKNTPSLALGLKDSQYEKHLQVSLTFDDGPNDEFTPQLLDVMNKYGVKGTFFLMGAYVDEYPEMTKRIVDEGHYLGNHTYNHFDLHDLTDEEVKTQFEWTNMAIEEATGTRPKMYRMPFGGGGERVYNLMADSGMESILWNLDSLDWKTQDRDMIVEEVMNDLQEHSLILMHDTNQATVDAIDILIPKLQEMGYEFVSPLDIDFELRYFPE